MKRSNQEVTLSFGAIAHHHDQPPIDSPARVYCRARYVSPDTTMRELFNWAIAEPALSALEITWEDARNLSREPEEPAP